MHLGALSSRLASHRAAALGLRPSRGARRPLRGHIGERRAPSCNALAFAAAMRRINRCSRCSQPRRAIPTASSTSPPSSGTSHSGARGRRVRGGFVSKQPRRGARVIASIFALAGRGTADHRTGPPCRRDAHRDSARGSSSDRAAIAQLRADVERPSRRRPPRRQPSRDSGRRFFTSPKHAAPSTLPDKFRHCARGALSIFDIKSKTRAIRVNKNNLANQWNIHKNNPQQSK
ncbi:hypothetical protein [Burkholderia pseudomallei]|uniref:hypothetical protein n=1 Tax=Burkholderia pseudomallei TaxID=28450 RepID=UPI001884A973|nr:hypothetical protein [Burkholderia pseudomallei]